MNYGLIAERLGHSFSKTVHSMIDNYDYTMRELPKDEFDAFMTSRDFKGINVTIPYKQDVIPYLDEISDTAKEIGAVNTIVNKDGKLCGYNTDFGGLWSLILKNRIEIKNRKVLILGTGGTSKTAAAVAATIGAREIIKLSRSGKDGAVTYEEAYERHADADVIINTTPCGMFPKNEGIPCDIEKFQNLSGVVDVIFNPLQTNLVLNAKKRGIKAAGGLYMLIAQAVLAAEKFTGKRYTESLTDKIYEKILKDKQNIVLCGMPASGKTTVGKKIAEKLGREFIDLDKEIVKNSGREITDIFAKDGEKYFRDLETEAAAENSQKTGAVISTGGGCVLREKNVMLLKQNGMLFFLDRPLCDLLPTDDRPLANSADKIINLYKERYHIYEKAANTKIEVSGGIDETVSEVIEKFFNDGEYI
ncbi:MAG: shikimate dehydrogenase [Clostridia bacterium]|nr:shikimate dehydrogenase [Clostridia bacterium]